MRIISEETFEELQTLRREKVRLMSRVISAELDRNEWHSLFQQEARQVSRLRARLIEQSRELKRRPSTPLPLP